MKRMTPEDIGRMVALHIDAKDRNWRMFFCRKCGDLFKPSEMYKIKCYCCGTGKCIKCNEEER